MLRLSSGLLNQPVLSLRLGGQVATAQNIIINPRNLKIIGWWCRKPGASIELVLLAEDVREITPAGLAINDEEVLSAPDELVRHSEVLEARFQLIDKLVKTKRQKLGKVSDFSYDEGLFVQKLYVLRPMVKVFSNNDTLIIDRDQIVEVTDHYILVNDNEAKATDKDLATAQADALAA